LGTRQSMPWFFAWLFMTVMAGVFDYVLSGSVRRFDLQTVAVFFVLNFAAISVMIYSLLWYFANEKQKLRALVDASHEEIRQERDRSEKLLLNILPPAIAERLKRNEANIAQGHADVTVLVADIVGFTRMTEELSPVETVKILNDVFSVFDDLADRYHVEKIKTIGDAYMAAAGLETGAQIHYADAIASMALEMQAKIVGAAAGFLDLRLHLERHARDAGEDRGCGGGIPRSSPASRAPCSRCRRRSWVRRR